MIVVVPEHKLACSMFANYQHAEPFIHSVCDLILSSYLPDWKMPNQSGNPPRKPLVLSGDFSGLLTIFCRHTSASLLIQENADPTVRSDIEAYFDRLAPEEGPYDHSSERLDDKPAHLKTSLTQVQLSIPLLDGVLVLGTWQGIYLFEHRVRPHKREIVLHLIGEE